MKYYELSKEEKEILKDFEDGAFKSIPNVRHENRRYESYARAHFNKTRTVNLRLSERDVHKLKVRAAEVGIPYQTLVASILHQYGNSAN